MPPGPLLALGLQAVGISAVSLSQRWHHLLPWVRLEEWFARLALGRAQFLSSSAPAGALGCKSRRWIHLGGKLGSRHLCCL